MTNEPLDELTAMLRVFAKERDWEQFHSPKNLAAALVVEASEVLEHFQWLTESQASALSNDVRNEVALELADVLLYLLRLADKLGVNLLDVAQKKIQINAEKYPINLSKGSSKKYTEFK